MLIYLHGCSCPARITMDSSTTYFKAPNLDDSPLYNADNLCNLTKRCSDSVLNKSLRLLGLGTWSDLGITYEQFDKITS